MTQNTQIEALKPCPFCGGTFVAQGSSRDYISVWCDCGARGPEVKFPENCDPLPPIDECRAAWNRRALREAPVPGDEPVAKPIGYASDYGLGQLAKKAHQYCLTVSVANEKEFTNPLFASPAVAPVARVDGPDEIEIDRLRLAAFKTNSNEDKAAYYLAVSKWFQDRHWRSSIIPATKGGEDAQIEAMTETAIDGPGYVQFYPSFHDCKRLLDAAALAQDTDGVAKP